MPTATVTPVLAYPDVRQAVAWLCGAFGFSERLRIAEHRAQLCFGEGSIVVTGGSAGRGGPHNCCIMIRVADVDSHHDRAKQAGARILNAPADYPYGERQYTAQDPGGHVWTFSQTVEDTNPADWGGTLYDMS